MDISIVACCCCIGWGRICLFLGCRPKDDLKVWNSAALWTAVLLCAIGQSQLPEIESDHLWIHLPFLFHFKFELVSSLFIINAAFKNLNGVTRLVYATCCILLDSSLTLVCCSHAASECTLFASHFSRAIFCKLRAIDFYRDWGRTDFSWNWCRANLTFMEVGYSLYWLITASNCFRDVFLFDWGIDRRLVRSLGRIKSLFISFEWFEILFFVRQILRYQACFAFMIWALRVGNIFNYFYLILAWVLIS